MTEETAKVALQFMQRVQLHGHEVPAFNAVCAALLEELKPQPKPVEGQANDRA